MAASLTLSSTVLNGSFAYTDEGVSASGTFSANDGAVVGISGSDELGDFSAVADNDSYVYTLKPADLADAGDLATLAAAVVEAINAELAPAADPADDNANDGEGGEGGDS